MAELAADVFDETMICYPDRQVEVRIGPLPPAHGGWRLIRQVFANLIGNALKVTRRAEHALIEIGGEIQGNRRAYYVRDNGVGFDAKSNPKLFSVFARLHPTSQFDGCGVGLAVVRRVVERHGGEVAAESEVGKGATFHFSLPL